MQSVRLFSVGHSLFASAINFFHPRNLVAIARRTLIVCLVVLLISNQTLAATGFVMAGAELGQKAHLWWHRSGWAAKFDRSFPTRSRGQVPKGWDGKGAPSGRQPAPNMTEEKEDREQKIARVQIFPGDISIQTGQQAVFTAVAYDKDGSPISGLDVSWEGFDEEKNEPAAISKTAVFDSGKPGKFKITADVAGRKVHVKVTVVGMERAPNISSPPGEPVSSHDKPKPKKTALFAPTSNERSQSAMRNDAKSRGARQPLRASASALSPGMTLLANGFDAYGWNPDNFTTMDDPGTDRGPVSGHAVDGGAGSGNFQFTAPLIGLGGRGIDINLGFNYLSRLWHKSGTEMYFDVDRDWVPGWIFGFGKIVMAGTSYVMIDADGTRHPYSGRSHGDFPAPYTSLQTYEAYTTDGSYINYYAEGYKGEFDNSNGHNMVRAWAKLPNGTTVIYGAAANYAMYPTQIIDANGNYITITYRTYWRFFAGQWRFVQEGPNIETMTDTLGRTIQFHYQRTGAAPDEKDLLTAVTAPGLNGGPQRVIVRLQYDSKNLNNAGANYGFQAGLTPRVRNNGVFDAIRAIYYPATGTGYWLGDADSYSPYGMIRKVSERRTMSCSVGGGDCAVLASLTLQPTVGAGVMSREMTYNHTSQPGYSYPHIFGSLSDAPTYTQMTEDWAGRSTPTPPLTKYSVVDLGSTRRTTIVRPDGVRVEQDTNDDPNSLYNGLLIEDRTYSEETGGTLLRRSTVNWFRTCDPQTDPDNSDLTFCAPRPTRTEVFDERNQKTASDYFYGDYNSLVDKIEYGYGGTTRLHRVHSEYDNGASYGGFWINRHTLWFDGGTSPDWFGAHIFNRLTSTSVYAADNVTRVSHAAYFYDEGSVVPRPDAGQLAGVAWPRGNLTTMKKYPDAVNLNESTAVVETRAYDACGNVVTLTTACCEQTSFEFQSGTRYAWPVVIKRGSPTDVNKQNITSYGYDLNTGLLLNSTDANGRLSSTIYQTLTLRPEYVYSPTGAYNFHIYDESGVVYDFAYEAGKSGADFASRSDKYLDGHGRVGGEIAYGKDYVMDFVHTQYDNLGRLSRQTRPFRGGETMQWTVYEYDKLDRTTKVTAPDGSVVERFYNESSYPSVATQGVPGQTARARDPWGRERWVRFDDRNRLVEVVEPDPNGNGAVATGGMKTNYSYDTLGNLTLVTQGDQTRSFKYDALNRLTHQKLAERDATLDNSGAFVATRHPSLPIYSGGVWSDVFTYDNRSNLTQRVDARGVKTNHNYNNDPLNRLQSVTHDKSGVPAVLLNDFPIPDAPSVSYAYMTTGSKNRLQNYVVSSGVGNETFAYDSEGRLAQSTQTFAGREGYPLVKNYVMDSLDRVKELYYPVQYGGSGVAKKVEPTYDVASRFNSLKFDGTTFASNPVYNASSQVESLNIGSFKQETYTYDPQTGLLTNQQVKQGANVNLTLGYSYAQNPDMGNNGPKTGQLTRVFDPGTAYLNRNNYYDALGRLKEVRAGFDQVNPSWKQTYAYDRYGNRTSVTKSGPGSGSVPLDGLASLSYTNGQGQTVNNRMTTAGYVYDPAGNQTRGESASGTWLRYRYDAAGRLADVRNDSDQSLETYSYGASNQRLKTDYFGGAGAPPTYYVWDGGQVICDYRGSQFSSALGWEKFYVYLGGRLLATLELVGGTKYHHPDRLGTRLASDAATGAITTSQTNLPYGTALETSGVATNRRFTSYDRSASTGMDYAVNRFYNPAQGRFTQVDPIGVAAASSSDPQTLNMYTYCGNDPINHVDPDGLFFGKLFGWIGKAFKFLFKVVAVALFVAAMVLLPTMIAAGGFWLASGAWFGWGSWAALMGIAGAAGLAGWHNGKPGAIAGAFLTRIGGSSNFRTPHTFPGGVNSFLQDPNVKVMTRGPEEDSSWFRLLVEWATGLGPEERQFGPNSSMTKEIRSSPDVDHHRKAFCAGGQQPYNGGRRFGLLGWSIGTHPFVKTDAADGLVRAHINFGRQFVGSYMLKIRRIAGSDEVSFVAYNETSIRSLLAGLPFEVSRNNGKSILELPGSTTKQYFSWTETNPCGQK